MKAIRTTALILAILIFAICTFLICKYFLSMFKAEKTFDDMKTSKINELWEKNHDFIGWLEIPGTHIDYPIMHTPNDPEYYLRRDFNKKYSIAGTPFMDARSNLLAPTNDWLFYGHNMRSGTMFHDLLKYADKEFYEKHKYLTFESIYSNRSGTWQVMAAFYARIDTDDFRYDKYAGMQTESKYTEYMEKVKQNALYDTGITATYDDQLITLSTCSYHVPKKRGRFVVVAKKIGDLEKIKEVKK